MLHITPTSTSEFISRPLYSGLCALFGVTSNMFSCQSATFIVNQYNGLFPTLSFRFNIIAKPEMSKIQSILTFGAKLRLGKDYVLTQRVDCFIRCMITMAASTE